MACIVVRAPCALRTLPRSAVLNSWRCRRQLCTSGMQRNVQRDPDREGHENDHGSIMLQHEEDLPRLPVPSLQETAERYLRSVQPLLSQADYEKTSSIVSSFIQARGPGVILQERLEARRRDPDVKNWLSDWWNEAAYMAYREPVVPFTSYYFSFLDDPKRRDPVKRAAATVAAVLEFKKLVDEETLTPEHVKGTPLAMIGYRYLFNSCRIPSKPCDYIKTYHPKEHKHLIVIRNNMFFKVIHDYQGTPLNHSELEQQFEHVYALAKRKDDNGVGILTSENRDIWTDARERLVQSSKANEEALIAIQSASFVVCLDDAAPSSLNDRARQYFLDNSSNRWYDKGVNFIVCDSGAMGYYGEHSMIDGAPVLRMTNSVLGRMMQDDFCSNEETVRSDIPGPQQIKFELSESNLNDIQTAQIHFDGVKSQQRLHAEYFPGYGKKAIKSMKCAPDAFLQLVIQLAYRLFSGKTRPTYEAIGTRRFQYGRTEACRVVTNDSIAFCDSMLDPLSTNEMRRSLFNRAMETLILMQEAAGEGKGVDRHLFGLQKLVREDEEMPAIFTDPAYTYSHTWYVTSSQVSSEFCHGFGFAQVVPEGIGIAYMINENSISFNIASQTEDCERVGTFLSEAASKVSTLMRGE